ncbi:UNVERIFIED_ORG: hypothetical protein EDC92_10969 [Dietzia maris]
MVPWSLALVVLGGGGEVRVRVPVGLAGRRWQRWRLQPLPSPPGARARLGSHRASRPAAHLEDP